MYLTILKPIMGGMFSYLCVAILMASRDKEIGYKSTASEIIKISILFTLFSHIFSIQLEEMIAIFTRI
ncbi:hypothetical protein [Gallibacterium anatis]|uniref:hypothetical protein n=1 Tax=Gallibacterium anatis TaxID=750 RepID=UPI0039FD6166